MKKNEVKWIVGEKKKGEKWSEVNYQKKKKVKKWSKIKQKKKVKSEVQKIDESEEGSKMMKSNHGPKF